MELRNFINKSVNDIVRIDINSHNSHEKIKIDFDISVYVDNEKIMVEDIHHKGCSRIKFTLEV